MTRPTAIHQFLAGYSTGDAISNEARVMRSIFGSWGYASDIFVDRRCVLPELTGDAIDLKSASECVRVDDIVILHLSIGTVANDVFAGLSCRKAILYHNMTPPDYLRGVQEEVARKLAWGRDQARMLAGKASVVMADSCFNAEELRILGYGEVLVIPLLLDFSAIRTRPDRRVMKTLRDGRTNILFVGRCVPNKRIEDLLSAFCFFSRLIMPSSRFVHVGSFAGMERYHAILLAHAQSMDLKNILFKGSVSQEELTACYRTADLFLCMSEHEGFCIPLLESMAHDVPVLAYAAAAVPETMDGAGVLFREKKFGLIAEMMGMLVRDVALRKSVIREQRIRLARYESRELEGELKSALAPIFDPEPQL